MVHLEVNYLTHSKFSTTMIPDFLMDFVVRILFLPRFEVVLSLFRTRFWIFHKLILYRSVCTRFKALWKNDTSILFRSRFEVDLDYWYIYPPSLEVRSWSLMVTCSLYWTYTWRPVKLGSVLVLHLKASQTWFLFYHMSIYLDLPFTASVYSFLSNFLPGLTLDCQFGYAFNFVTYFTWLDLQL